VTVEGVPAGPLAIDTDAFSYIHIGRGPHEAFAQIVRGHPLAMPFPVVGELKVMALHGKMSTRRKQALEQAISACVVIPSDARVVDQWAALRAKLITRLKGEGINDLWIAACCLVHDLPIVTNNLSDFLTIQSVEPRLRVIHPGD
jgi:predicted nucleic acid-binding protein